MLNPRLALLEANFNERSKKDFAMAFTSYAEVSRNPGLVEDEAGTHIEASGRALS